MDHIKTLTIDQYMEMVVEQQFGQSNKKEKQYAPESGHLAFDAGGLLAHLDSILQDGFNALHLQVMALMQCVHGIFNT